MFAVLGRSIGPLVAAAGGSLACLVWVDAHDCNDARIVPMNRMVVAARGRLDPLVDAATDRCCFDARGRLDPDRCCVVARGRLVQMNRPVVDASGWVLIDPMNQVAAAADKGCSGAGTDFVAGPACCSWVFVQVGYCPYAEGCCCWPGRSR